MPEFVCSISIQSESVPISEIDIFEEEKGEELDRLGWYRLIVLSRS